MLASKVPFKLYDLDAKKTVARKKEMEEAFAYYGTKFVDGFDR